MIGSQRAFARSEDVEDMLGTTANGTVRLLPAFDQYVLGPGTSDSHVIPPAHRPDVSQQDRRLDRARAGRGWPGCGYV